LKFEESGIKVRREIQERGGRVGKSGEGEEGGSRGKRVVGQIK
jgi:hypothetical protein